MTNFAFSRPKQYEAQAEGLWRLDGSSRVILMDGSVPWEDVAACVNLLGEEYPELGAAMCCYLVYKAVALGQFGGFTGDLAGWFVQVCELAMLAAIVLAERIGAVWF